jgi:secreted Zn-dependent insulinase-like peptidase
VVVVSDPVATRAAAAMSISVGSYSDPSEIPGLAHFLEHMVFNGNEKYPVEGAFDDFLSTHRGSTNAETGEEITNFFFDIRPSKLRDALDIWSQFFISPLIKPESAKREMRAVDSEFKNLAQKDGSRADEVLRATSNPASPFSRFSCGNLRTLETDPTARKIDVVEAVRAFRRRHYVTSNMRLVLYGRESVDVLARWAEELFKGVPSQPSAGASSSSSSSGVGRGSSGGGGSDDSGVDPRAPLRTQEQIPMRLDVVAQENKDVRDTHTVEG